MQALPKSKRGEAMKEQDFLSTYDASKILGVSPETVRSWNRSGRLNATRTAGGMRLFQRDEVEKIAEKRSQESKAG
jgi:excisionase family DNA binding protein